MAACDLKPLSDIIKEEWPARAGIRTRNPKLVYPTAKATRPPPPLVPIPLLPCLRCTCGEDFFYHHSLLYTCHDSFPFAT